MATILEGKDCGGVVEHYVQVVGVVSFSHQWIVFMQQQASLKVEVFMSGYIGYD